MTFDMTLDFTKQEYGPEYLRALVREAQAESAARRRERGIPDRPNTFLGVPIVFVDQLPQSKADEE